MKSETLTSCTNFKLSNFKLSNFHTLAPSGTSNFKVSKLSNFQNLKIQNFNALRISSLCSSSSPPSLRLVRTLFAQGSCRARVFGVPLTHTVYRAVVGPPRLFHPGPTKGGLGGQLARLLLCGRRAGGSPTGAGSGGGPAAGAGHALPRIPRP